MNRPWLKFYPTDWRADPAVRSCSLAARGLWIEMLCVMHEATPRGSLIVGNSPVSPRQLASICGATLKETNRMLAELEAAGVFSREGEILYSRRMKREEQKAAEDKANGALGGNPKLKGGVNPQDKAHILDARSQKERKDAPDGAPPKYAFESGVIRLNQHDFDQWRDAFPNLDLKAELLSLTEWAGDQPKWFFAVSGALAKRNREVGIRKSSQQNGRPLTPSGNLWPEGIT